MSARDDETTAPAPAVALARHREHIDRIDKTIVALLEQRLHFGVAVGNIKRELSRPTRNEEREADVIARVQQAASGRLSPESAARVFTTIIEVTREAQDAGRE